MVNTLERKKPVVEYQKADKCKCTCLNTNGIEDSTSNTLAVTQLILSRQSVIMVMLLMGGKVSDQSVILMEVDAVDI